MGETVLLNIQPGVRLLVAVAFVLSVVVASTHWAVRHQKISAFGAWARFIRRCSDPLLLPVERRLVRAGANPQDAPIWLVGLTVVAGLVLIALVDWLLNFAVTLYQTAHGGSLIPMLVHYIFAILELAIWVRVIASWLRPSPHALWVRVVHGLTDWIVEPLQRIIPPIGMFDFSVLVAYLVLVFAESVAMRMLM
ncbi:MAG TPA: YggT family protein [Gemmatimonadales bacterium]|jgi:YggT family protein